MAINYATECFFFSLNELKFDIWTEFAMSKMFSSKINKFITLLCSNVHLYNPLNKGLNAKDFREILYISRNNQLMEMLSCGNCKEKV